jgi:hypothetical protein
MRRLLVLLLTACPGDNSLPSSTREACEQFHRVLCERERVCVYGTSDSQAVDRCTEFAADSCCEFDGHCDEPMYATPEEWTDCMDWAEDIATCDQLESNVLPIPVFPYSAMCYPRIEWYPPETRGHVLYELLGKLCGKDSCATAVGAPGAACWEHWADRMFVSWCNSSHNQCDQAVRTSFSWETCKTELATFECTTDQPAALPAACIPVD